VLDRFKDAARRRQEATVFAGSRPLASLSRSARGAAGAGLSREARKGKGKTNVLRIYETVIEVLRGLRPVVTQIENHDRDLARQLRRAASSVALNISEGSGCSGGTRRERYRNALGSARETGACLDVAVACGYVGEIDSVLLSQLDRVRAVLVKNVV
jgi:four helix bundle protein